eukprot:g11976.t1
MVFSRVWGATADQYLEDDRRSRLGGVLAKLSSLDRETYEVLLFFQDSVILSDDYRAAEKKFLKENMDRDFLTGMVVPEQTSRTEPAKFQACFQVVSAAGRQAAFEGLMRKLAVRDSLVRDLSAGKMAKMEAEIWKLFAAVAEKPGVPLQSIARESRQRLSQARGTEERDGEDGYTVLACTPEVHASVKYDSRTGKTLVKIVTRLEDFSLREMLDCALNFSKERGQWDDKWSEKNQEYLVQRKGEKEEWTSALLGGTSKVMKVGKACVRGERFMACHMDTLPGWVVWLAGLPDVLHTRQLFKPVYEGDFDHRAPPAGETGDGDKQRAITGLCFAMGSWNIKKDQPADDGYFFVKRAGCVQQDFYSGGKQGIIAVDIVELDNSFSWVPHWILVRCAESFGLPHINQILNMYKQYRAMVRARGCQALLLLSVAGGTPSGAVRVSPFQSEENYDDGGFATFKNAAREHLADSLQAQVRRDGKQRVEISREFAHAEKVDDAAWRKIRSSRNMLRPAGNTSGNSDSLNRGGLSFDGNSKLLKAWSFDDAADTATSFSSEKEKKNAETKNDLSSDASGETAGEDAMYMREFRVQSAAKSEEDETRNLFGRGSSRSNSDSNIMRGDGVGVAASRGMGGGGTVISKSSGSSILFLLGCSGAALSIIYQDEIWEYLGLDQYDNVFDEFNHHSREFFMRVGDFLVPPPAEPWLLDFETLKYPPHLPTLVVDLDKVVCKLEYDRKTGWQVRKRPGADRFFNELQHYYEIVVFSDDVFPVAGDVMQKWGIPVGGVLHREFCQRYYKHFRKDISKLGRNLERVIHIDHDRIAVEKHPENAIVVPEYNPAPRDRAQDDDNTMSSDHDAGDDDTALLDLIDFLKAAMHQNDVREFLKRYGGDGDVGKRYLLEKQEREQLVAKRRSAFNFGGGGMARKRTDPTGRRF